MAKLPPRQPHPSTMNTHRKEFDAPFRYSTLRPDTYRAEAAEERCAVCEFHLQKGEKWDTVVQEKLVEFSGVTTREYTEVPVGVGCLNRVKAAGKTGYVHPMGGPRFFAHDIYEVLNLSNPQQVEYPPEIATKKLPTYPPEAGVNARILPNVKRIK